jgi:hypothetical protein
MSRHYFKENGDWVYKQENCFQGLAFAGAAWTASPLLVFI